MSESIRVNGVLIQFEAEAFAGITMTTGERHWGTRIKWRKGTAGAWKHFNVIDLHPFDSEGVRQSVLIYVGDRL